MLLALSMKWNFTLMEVAANVAGIPLQESLLRMDLDDASE
jgi:hypothetical protein